ncbi:MAG TPA: non-homologous end-joining DNA ligase [Acidimicrobiales bacterium]|nr:non-homologous end-joining DNA ligase [Acidimicrobiales bacterium]
MSAARRTLVEVDGRELSLSNLDKVMYPEVGFTKAEVIDYYRRIAPVMVPHLEGRPITLVRFPDGVEGQHFFEKNCPSHRPPWFRTVDIESTGRRSGRNRTELIHYCLIESGAHLVWTANMAALELHPGLQTEEDLGRPTYVVFDLDPGAPADEVTCAEVAVMIRSTLEDLDLQSWVKTSGSKGLQLYVPLNRDGVTFDDTRDFALALGQLLERTHPDLVTTNMAKEHRPGKVFVDWSQNTFSKTTVAVYSMRARARPTVSTPLEWGEVEAAIEAGDASSLRFDAHQVLERVEQRGDLFEPVRTVSQRLPAG